MYTFMLLLAQRGDLLISLEGKLVHMNNPRRGWFVHSTAETKSGAYYPFFASTY